MSDKEILTPSELCDRWGVHLSTLRNWRSQKCGPKYIKLGPHEKGKVLYRVQDIVDYERKMVQKTGTKG